MQRSVLEYTDECWEHPIGNYRDMTINFCKPSRGDCRKYTFF